MSKRTAHSEGRKAQGAAPRLSKDADSPHAVVNLERLEPDPLLLEVPPGLEQAAARGEFTVAKTPPTIDFARPACQEEKGHDDNWSHWGDGLYGPDGMFYVSLGNHASPHGYAYVHRIDPATGEVRLVADVDKVLNVPRHVWTPGKIHSPLTDGGDGHIYFATYRGDRLGTLAEHGYGGDHIFRHHIASGKTEDLGVFHPFCSVSQMLYYAPLKRLYAFACFGQAHPEPRRNYFVVYDVEELEKIHVAEPEPRFDPRMIIVGPDGRAWYNMKGEALARYDPVKNITEATSIRLPGRQSLRAASRPDSNGICYCITRHWGRTLNPQAGVVFAFDTKTEGSEVINRAFVQWLSPAYRLKRKSDTRKLPLYTAICKLDPAGRKLYYIPSSHGGSEKHGTALIQMDLRTGGRKVLAFLNRHLRRAVNFDPAGTYSLVLNPDGSQICIAWNEGWGTIRKRSQGRVAVTILHIPESER